ncbi:Hypothetical predicted protein [Cloeon dipterum]|uniref:Uncharacterized protein n=1 Tax=Cloeon dipterum TaxID=197152 RepID=A0A8S1DNH0_9INSE|nr:Hypothetical predicted protein [Cloeon dipterum]
MVQCQWLRFSSRRVVPISEFDPSKFVNVQEAVLARTWHEGNLLPGYALLGQNAGYFVDENCMARKMDLTELHIICGNANMWKLHQEGQELPGNAIQIGKTDKNEPLYVGCVSWDGVVLYGKVRAGGSCFVATKDAVLEAKTYFILVETPRGLPKK